MQRSLFTWQLIVVFLLALTINVFWYARQLLFVTMYGKAA
jgi:hypothetical protein